MDAAKKSVQEGDAAYSFCVSSDLVTAYRCGSAVGFKLNGIRLSRAAIVAALTT
jgi:hypothetical protein